MFNVRWAAKAKEVVALYGFKNITDTAILQLCKHYSVNVGDPVDTYEAMKALIMHCVPNIDTDRLYEILASRHVYQS